jgi:alkanesulfonate monooxygenase SsuD/methylene tetrahydromethanopterin reductase-like flavin-dependent oxidoreductase (luciferase family)
VSERLGLGLIPGTGWHASEIQDVARAAEAAGFEAVFCAEVNNDAIATAQLMGLATRTSGSGPGSRIPFRDSPIFAPRRQFAPPRRPRAG